MNKINDLDFIAIDFETATPDLSSACSVGLAFVSHNTVIDTFYSLIRPPENEYAKENTAIHGLSAADTADAYPAYIVLQPLLSFLKAGIPLVAHNARFDISVLYHCFNGHILDFKFMDTRNMAAPLHLKSTSLSSCVDALGLELGQHHNARDDAVACAEIAIACYTRSSHTSFSNYCLYSPHIKIYNFSDIVPLETIYKRSPHQTKWPNKVRPKDIIAESPLDSSNPFFGKDIVFTGELSISRSEAMQLVANAGAINKSSVSSKTDYLVVGVQDPSIVDESGKSGKEKKAEALNASGKAHIEILNEDDFFLILGKAKTKCIQN